MNNYIPKIEMAAAELDKLRFDLIELEKDYVYLDRGKESCDELLAELLKLSNRLADMSIKFAEFAKKVELLQEHAFVPALREFAQYIQFCANKHSHVKYVYMGIHEAPVQYHEIAREVEIRLVGSPAIETIMRFYDTVKTMGMELAYDIYYM